MSVHYISVPLSLSFSGLGIGFGLAPALYHAAVEVILGLYDLEDLFGRHQLEDAVKIAAFQFGHIHLQLLDAHNRGFGIPLSILLEVVDLSAHLALLGSHLIVEGEERLGLFGRERGSLGQ